MAHNKRKIQIVLRSSKTHLHADHPQIVKIASSDIVSGLSRQEQHCPFLMLQNYMDERRRFRGAKKIGAPLFVFKDGSPLKPEHVRLALKRAIKQCGLDSALYDCHSLRVGRSTDLMRAGLSVDTIKQVVRWRSNAVYKYIRDSDLRKPKPASAG